MYELVIIGGGPAAAAAAVYASRKQIKTGLITESFGGQSVVSNEIYNWIGSKSISGLQLAKNLEEHVRAHDLDIFDGERVVRVDVVAGGPPTGHFRITTTTNATFETRTLMVASGSRRKRLGIPGEDRLDGKGVVFCSTCDAPLFKGKDVAIVGAGNAGLEAVVDSIPYARNIYLLVRGTELKGDAVTQAKIKGHPKVTIMFGVVTEEVLGDTSVSGVRYQDKTTSVSTVLPVQGLFVEIGSLPNADFVKEVVKVNAIGEIIVDHQTQQSSMQGIWAAGDVSDVLYKQNNISAGDAVKAILNIYEYLHKNHLFAAHDAT